MARSSSFAARAWAAGFALLAAVHLGALLAGADQLADVSQWLLMPALAGVLVTATRWPRGRLVRWTLVGLGFSWLGDTLPSFVPDDLAFLAMVGCFLLAQTAYVVAFAPLVRRSVVHRAPWALVGYGVVLAVLVGLCAPEAGSLLVPVAVYGGMLTAMAVLSTGLGRAAGIGGAVFLVSDALIALEEFVPAWEIPAQGFWVMLTYVVGQALLVTGVVAANRAERRAPAVRGTATPGAKRDNVVALA